VDLIGVLRQTVASIEGGKSSFSLELAFRIAQVFRVPLEESFEFVSCRRVIADTDDHLETTRRELPKDPGT
jgi:DNA-binding XRE family transcriptional regulator